MTPEQQQARVQAATRAAWSTFTEIDRWELSVSDVREMVRRGLAAADEAVPVAPATSRGES